MNNIAVHIGMQVPLQDLVFSAFGYIHKGGTAGSYCSFIFYFLRTTILLSIVAAPVHIPTNSAQRFQFLHSLTNSSCSLLLGSGHPERCKVISHCSFDYISLMINDVEYVFQGDIFRIITS